MRKEVGIVEHSEEKDRWSSPEQCIQENLNLEDPATKDWMQRPVARCAAGA